MMYLENTNCSIKPPQNAALRTVVEMGLFTVLLEAQNTPLKSSEVTADQLAVITGSSKALVGELFHYYLADSALDTKENGQHASCA